MADTGRPPGIPTKLATRTTVGGGAGSLRRSWLATPWALAVGVPLLIAVTGGGIGLIQQSALHLGAKRQALAAFKRMAGDATRRAEDCLNQAEPILDALVPWARTGPDLEDDAQVARTLLTLAAGRPGVAYVHLSTDQGVYLGIRVDPDGFAYERVDRLPRGGGRSRAWRMEQDGRLGHLELDELDRYDPRSRPFWRAAAGARGRTWTEPYAFVGKPVTGVARAEPVLRPDGAPRLVLTVEFDLSTLGDALDHEIDPNEGRSVIFDDAHQLIALPRDWRPAEAAPGGRTLLAADLQGEDARGFFAAAPVSPRDGLETFKVAIGSDVHSGAVADLAVAGMPTWHVGLLTHRESLLGLADEARERSLWLGLAALLAGTAGGAWFALALARTQAEARDQRHRAHEAERKARDLGSWHLIRRLGRGGMGEVWLASHRLLARPAAVKLISSATIAGDDPAALAEARARFVREARTLAGLRHRNTIEIYDYGEAGDGTFYYVMELLDGLDLRDLVLRHGPIPWPRAVHFLRQACGSLAEAHGRGLVHRDIKPDNLFTCRRADEVDLLKVLDFGIVARFRKAGDPSSAQLTRNGTVQGTPATMSPEQAMGLGLDPRSDLYSLGCVGYWLLTGSDPFRYADAHDLMNAHVHQPPQPPSERLGKPLPAELERIILDLLAKDPEQRPRNARDLILRLDALTISRDDAWTSHHAAAWWDVHLPAGVENATTDLIGANPTVSLPADLRRVR